GASDRHPDPVSRDVRPGIGHEHPEAGGREGVGQLPPDQHPRLRDRRAQVGGRQAVRRRAGDGDDRPGAVRRRRNGRAARRAPRDPGAAHAAGPAVRPGDGRGFRPARAAAVRRRALRGLRRAHHRRPVAGRAEPGRLRPQRRRAGGDGRRRRGRPAPARRAGRRARGGRRELRRRAAGVPPVHPPARVPRHGRPRRPARRQPRGHRRLAHGTTQGPHARAAARPLERVLEEEPPGTSRTWRV
ncbi:MAG: tRNA (guanine(37)-N(1))-methyltransferase, partial [uncultured Phycisphaerae bacterium]